MLDAKDSSHTTGSPAGFLVAGCQEVDGPDGLRNFGLPWKYNARCGHLFDAPMSHLGNLDL